MLSFFSFFSFFSFCFLAAVPMVYGGQQPLRTFSWWHSKTERIFVFSAGGAPKSKLQWSWKCSTPLRTKAGSKRTLLKSLSKERKGTFSTGKTGVGWVLTVANLSPRSKKETCTYSLAGIGWSVESTAKIFPPNAHCQPRFLHFQSLKPQSIVQSHRIVLFAKSTDPYARVQWSIRCTKNVSQATVKQSVLEEKSRTHPPSSNPTSRAAVVVKKETQTGRFLTGKWRFAVKLLTLQSLNTVQHCDVVAKMGRITRKTVVVVPAQ
jgi:hypothetical protein